jgi:hypothetical protein
MARVSVEVVALTDRRFVALGRTLGFDRFAALGRMILVWHTCQEEERHHLTEQELDDIHPDLPHFGAAVESACLAQRDGDVLYISGTKGRIEWLAARRKEGKKGGRPHIPTVSPTDNPRDILNDAPPSNPGGLPQNNPLTLTPTPSKEPTKDTSPRKRGASPPFVKPIIEEVTAYCQERGRGVNPQKWMDHYEAKGWKIGRTKMQDWKAAVRTWEGNEFSTPSKPDPLAHAKVGRQQATHPTIDPAFQERRLAAANAPGVKFSQVLKIMDCKTPSELDALVGAP